MRIDGMNGCQLLSTLKKVEEEIQDCEGEIKAKTEAHKEQIASGDMLIRDQAQLVNLKSFLAGLQDSRDLALKRLEYFKSKQNRLPEIRKDVAKLNMEAQKHLKEIEEARKKVGEHAKKLREIDGKIDALQDEYGFLNLNPESGLPSKVLIHIDADIQKFVQES